MRAEIVGRDGSTTYTQAFALEPVAKSARPAIGRPRLSARLRRAFAHGRGRSRAAMLSAFVHDGSQEVALRCEGLVKRFGTLTAVNGLSFEVQRGECFGLLGPNGAGQDDHARDARRADRARRGQGRDPRPRLPRPRNGPARAAGRTAAADRAARSAHGGRDPAPVPQLLSARPLGRSAARPRLARRKARSACRRRCPAVRSSG